MFASGLGLIWGRVIPKFQIIVLGTHLLNIQQMLGDDQVLPLRTRVDLGAIAMKGYSAFPKAPVLLEPHHQSV